MSLAPRPVGVPKLHHALAVLSLSSSLSFTRLFIIAAVGLTAIGCKGKPGASSGGSTARISPGVAPLLVADSAGVRHYLETVDTVKGATFNVKWSPNTVRLDRGETLRSLRRVSLSGSTFTFAAGEAKIRDLKPGQILLVWGIALRKVTAVEPKGDKLVVRTELVSLPEAIQDGTIAWKSRASFGAGMVSPSAPAGDTTKKRASLDAPAGLFRYASYHQGEGPQQGAGQGEPSGDKAGEPAEGEGAEDEAELPNHAAGELGGYEFEVGYGRSGGGLDFQLEARKSDEGPFNEPQKDQGERTRAQGTKGVGGGTETGEEHGAALTKEEKKQKKEHEEQEKNTKQGVGDIEHPGKVLTPKGLFGMAAEVFDLRVKVRGHLDDFDTDGSMTVANSALGQWKSAVSNLNGDADLDWIARLGEKGVFSENIKVEVPFNFDIPLVIGGLPFMIEIGANFLAAPGLTSHHASAAGSYHITFNGGASITATPTGANTESSLTGNAETKDRQVTSLGVSAVLVAVQVPRIGFGLGLLNTSAVAYVDQVLATSVVTAGAVGLIPCRRYQIISSFGAGVGVQILGIKVPGVSAKHTLGTPFNKVVTEPAGLNCKVGGE